MSALYSLRSELEFSTQTQQGKDYVVVKDPVTLRYFRFSEGQAAILGFLRASPTDIETLSTELSERFAGGVARETLEGFLKSLDKKLLLDNPPSQAKLDEYRERRTRKRDGSLLYLRLISLNAEALFEWLFPKVRWCFTPAFHAFAVLIIVSGIFVTLLNGERLTTQLLSLLSLQGILMIWVIILLITAMHELAHGLTCRHFGGRVREVGLMLIYFMPAFYCDVSDAWMFPSRRQRVWVTFAGGYFQLVVWGVAAVVWRVAAQDTFISSVALAAILFGGMQTLVNFNPLIKLDGYYMLSDYLEIPNLRSKAFQAIRAWISGESEPLIEGVQRRPLLVYGGLSLTFSTVLLSVIYVNIFLLMTSYFAFAGLVGFVMFSGVTVRRAATEPVAGAKAMMTRAAIRKHRNLGIGLLLLILTFVIPWELRISSEFQVLPRQEVIVRSETAGTVAEIHVREGSHVVAGDVIAELYDFDMERELSLVVGELAQKQAELSLLVSGPRAEEVANARQLVETKQVELTNVRRNIQQRTQLEQTLNRERSGLRLAEIEFTRSRELFDAGLGPRVDMEKAEAQLEIQASVVEETESSLAILAEANDREADLKQRELAEAEGALNLLLAGFRTEEIEQRQAEVAALESQQMILDAEQRKRRIVAPISGTVVTPFVERLFAQHLEPGDELCRIVDLDGVSAELLVPEKEMSDVHPGSRVVLKVRSYPSRDFEGRVDFIAPVAETIGEQSYIKIRTELPNDDGALKTEMTGVAKIHGGRRLVIQLMTRRLIRWVRTEFWDLLP